MQHLLADGFYALFLEGFRTKMRIGVTPEEAVPQDVVINITAIVSRVGPMDGLADVVDYNHLRDAAIEMSSGAHVGLQETLCEGIIDRLGRHPSIAGVIVETRKTEIYQDAEAIGCRMSSIDRRALAR